MRNTKGITLIALIITIIVLLILAGVSINLIVGENGILKQSTDAVNIYKQKENQESGEFDNLYNEFGNYINNIIGNNNSQNSGENNTERVDSTSDLWEFDPDIGRIKYYKGTKAQLDITNNIVKIPTHIDGIEVKELGGEYRPVFSGENMNSNEISGEKLQLPYTLQKIGDIAFASNSGFTGNLILPNSVTEIGGNAFNGCTGFTGLKLSNSLTEIGSSAFRDCTGFVGELILPNMLTKIDTGVFYGCTGFTGKLVLPNSLTYIGGNAFEGCTGFSGDLILPFSVNEIYADAFNNCSGFNGKLTISSNALRLSVFHGTNFKILEIDVPEITQAMINANFYYGGRFVVDKLILTDRVKNIGMSAFSGYDTFPEDFVIPNSVTKISDSAFYNCTGLTGELVIPDSVTSIGSLAFGNITSLTSISVPTGCTVADNAFAGTTAEIITRE